MSEVSFGRKLKLVMIASIYEPIDRLFCWYLRRTRRDPYRMTDEKLIFIKRIRDAADPEIESPYEALECELDLERMSPCIRMDKWYVLTGENWYLLLVREIPFINVYEFSSATGRCSDILKIYRELLNLFSDKRFFCFCREDTSYPLVQSLAKRGKLIILKDQIREEEGRRLHRMLVRTSGD